MIAIRAHSFAIVHPVRMLARPCPFLSLQWNVTKFGTFHDILGSDHGCNKTTIFDEFGAKLIWFVDH